MPIWTAETQNTLAMSRIIPTLYHGVPSTVAVDRGLNFNLDVTERTVTLTGPWMLLAWRSQPGQDSSVATVSLEVDGILIFADGNLTYRKYVVGPARDPVNPGSGGAVPRYLIAVNEMVLTGRVIVGSILNTEYHAVKLEYA